jgi:poly-gamma-glutamate capsule biosynthesis protein CapA/YwtB (metallophosphatase superfamily)
MGESVKIAITGDFCLVHGVGELLAEKKYAKVFGDFKEGIAGADLHITNLECPLTNYDKGITKNGPCIKAKPELIEAIKYAEVDIVCLANNHILDYDKEGLFETIKVCNDAGIKTVGAGKNLDDAGKILYTTLKGISIAIINFAENEFTIATDIAAGANPLDLPRNYRSIVEAKKKADIVIVIVHGGNECYSLPSPRIVDTYRFFADAGADIVLAHHTHFYSGYEIHNGTPIFYNLGHFIFDWYYTREGGWYVGCALLLDIDKKGSISFELKPFYQSKKDIGFMLLKNEEKDIVLKDSARLSTIIADKDKLKKEWQLFCDQNRKQYYSNIFGLNKITKNLVKIPFIKNYLTPQRKKLELLNMIECEAHREVVVTMLKNEIKN